VTSTPIPSRLAAIAPWTALLALAAALSLQDIRSFDYWWHLRTGQLIVETGEVPVRDVFTYTTPGAPWIDINWLFQLGLYALHAAGGHAAVIVAQLVLVGITLALLAPIGWRRERTWLSVAALTLMLLVVANRLEPRPELVTLVLLACVLRLLDRFERLGDRALYAIVPLQLLWANLHGLFALGIAVCAIELAGELLRPLGHAHEPLRLPRVRRLAAVIGLSLLVTFMNPYGVDGALFPLRLFDMVGSAERRGTLAQVISELRSPIVSLRPLALALFLLLATLSGAAMAANWRRVRESDLLLWVAFFYLAMGANRNVALFAVVAAPILVRNLNEVLGGRRLPARFDAFAAAVTTAFALLVAGDAAFGRFYSRISPHQTPGFGVTEGYVPIEAAEWILRTRPPGPIAHWMGDGGYLIWRLWPEYRVMSDGRTLDTSGLDQPPLLIDDPEAFARLAASYRFGTVLLNYRRAGFTALPGWLHASPDWRLAYLDDVSVVFVRAEGDGARVAELDLDTPGLFPPLDDLPDPAARERFRARTRLLLRLERADLALREWELCLARFPDEPRGQEMLAAMRARSASQRTPLQPARPSELAPEG